MMRLAFRPLTQSPRTSYRSQTGRVAHSGKSVFHESALERDFFILLDFEIDVIRIQEQPFSVMHNVNGQERRYTPDVMVEFGNVSGIPKTVIYEVKYRDDLKSNWNEFRARFMAANHYCRENGMQFRIVTEVEIRTPLLENATFLRPYRRLHDNEIIRGQLLYTLRAIGSCTPQALLAAAYSCQESQTKALSTLWRMIAMRKISCDLQQPLTMQSVIRL